MSNRRFIRAIRRFIRAIRLSAYPHELHRLALAMTNGPVQDISTAVTHLETLLSLVNGGVAETHARRALSTLERALGDMRGHLAALRSSGIDRR